MIIYNTTFHVMNEVRADFLNWVRTVYVPQATDNRMLFVPMLTKIIGSEQDGGESYALQFRVQSNETLEAWKQEVGVALTQQLVKRYGNKVVGFTTLMEKLDL